MIIKSSKKSEVAAALATLKINKTYRIKEIVDTIKQVCNHQTDTTNSLKMNSGNYSGVGCVMLDELYVDLTYQRRIRLAKIINKLKKLIISMISPTQMNRPDIKLVVKEIKKINKSWQDI